MTFPESEINRLQRKTIHKTELVGMTPAQYILFRINHSSDQSIEMSSLDFDLDEIEMVPPKPGEDCEQVAVVKIRPSDSVNWKGELDYRIPQININRFYGDFIEVQFDEIKDLADYDDLARKFMMPPRTFKQVEVLGLEGTSISYRLDFNNPFFVGSLRVTVNGITNLITDKTVVDRLLQFTGSPT